MTSIAMENFILRHDKTFHLKCRCNLYHDVQNKNLFKLCILNLPMAFLDQEKEERSSLMDGPPVNHVNVFCEDKLDACN